MLFTASEKSPPPDLVCGGGHDASGAAFAIRGRASSNPVGLSCATGNSHYHFNVVRANQVELPGGLEQHECRVKPQQNPDGNST